MRQTFGFLALSKHGESAIDNFDPEVLGRTSHRYPEEEDRCRKEVSPKGRQDGDEELRRVSNRYRATQCVEALSLTGAMSLDSKSIRRMLVFSFVSAGGSFRAIVMTLSIS